MPIIPGALRGRLSGATIKDNRLRFTGWAADIKSAEIPEAIVIFLDGEFLHAGRANVPRQDLVNAYGNGAFRRVGFQFNAPLDLFEDLDNSEVRVFAVSKKGIASELNYFKGYKWGR